MYVHIVYRVGVLTSREKRAIERTRAPRGGSSREVQWWPAVVSREGVWFGRLLGGRACCDDLDG